MPGKADKPTQNSALQGISEQENFMIRVLFICHGSTLIEAQNPWYSLTFWTSQRKFTLIYYLLIALSWYKEKNK